jgi:hypothetical protein
MSITGAGGGDRAALAMTGDAELIAWFEQLPATLARKYLRKSVADFGRKVNKAARANLRTFGIKSRTKKNLRVIKASAHDVALGIADRTTIGLARSLTVRPSGSWPSKAQLAAAGVIAAAFGPRWPEGAHAHLVEFGHDIYTPFGQGNIRHKKAIPTGERTTPKPFYRPAVDSTKPQFIPMMAQSLRTGMEREAAAKRKR